MGKYIRITEEQIAQCKEEFAKALGEAKMSEGKFVFTKEFTASDRKAVVLFTAVAYTKMCALINSFSSEIGWYGVAERVGDDDDDIYLISDVLVYPQRVSGSYIDVDEEEMAKWIVDHLSSGDDRVGKLFMQSHSHVNMQCMPSGEDKRTMDKYLSTIAEDGFFISMIWNKRYEHHCKVFDMKKNLMFDDNEVSVSVVLDGGGLVDEFIDDSKKIVSTYVYRTTPAKMEDATPLAKTQNTETKTKSDTTKTPDKKPVESASNWKRSNASDADEEWDKYMEEWYARNGVEDMYGMCGRGYQYGY